MNSFLQIAFGALCLLDGIKGLCLPLAIAKMTSNSFLDSSTGLWELPSRVPLPPERLSMVESLSKSLAAGFSVTTDGRNRQDVALSPEELHDTFLPLCLAIREREDLARTEGRRCLVGFIGPPFQLSSVNPNKKCESADLARSARRRQVHLYRDAPPRLRRRGHRRALRRRPTRAVRRTRRRRLPLP